MQKPKPESERGITLIALIVIIVILVILSAIVIRGITGNDGLLKRTETASEEYVIKSYKEQLTEKVNNIIQTHSAIGEETSLNQIGTELEEETTWIKSTEVTTNSSGSNDNIMVTVTAGYVYEVYYNSTYGALFVEYCR